jgi:hypothetical protein
MTTLPFVASASRATALTALFVTATACAPANSPPPAGVALNAAASATPTSTPVLLSCPAGQQPLLRQVLVNGTAVPQVECVTAAAIAAPTPPPTAPSPPRTVANGFAALPAYGPAATPTQFVPYEPAAAAPAAVRTAVRAPARRAVYDDVVEYRRPSKRSWQKSAVIIGTATGAGAGVGALTGGKKGALIGAAVGGGAATVWDQLTRRQPR